MSDKKIEALELSPSFKEKAMKHKWMIVGGAICLAILFMIMVTKPSTDPNKYAKKAPPKPVANLLPGDARESDWIADAQVDLRKVQAELAEATRENKELKEVNAQAQADAKVSREQTAKALEEMSRFRAMVERGEIPNASIRGGDPSPKVEKEDKLPEGVIPPPRPGDLEAEVVPMPNVPGSGRVPAGGTPGTYQQPVPERRPMVLKGAEPGKVSLNGKGGVLRDAAGREVTEVVKKNPFRGYLPAGSFADVALLSGADVGTAEFTRANPQPFLMRVQSNAVTAGNGRYRLTACFIAGEGFGELSSERVFVRATRLVCMDKDQKLVLEETIKGYMVDSDGTQGLRGEVVRRSGQLIAKALLAGVAQGIAEVGRAAAQANATSITSPLTGGGLQQVDTSIDPKKLGEAGAFQGASNAAGLLADLYITEAKSMFPVIRVPAGRKGTLVIQEGKSLEWKTYEGLFVVEQVPVSTNGGNR